MNTLTIANTNVRQDALGRYCLADLHQAAGGEDRHRPTYWLKNKSTQETLNVLKLEDGITSSNFDPVATVKGHGITATYVVWELVYDYAMWVSPAFKIKVIRAYNTLQSRTVSQNEIYWFARRPRWEFIRRLALEGWPYRAIAKMFDPRLGQGSIANSVQAMVVRGLINPQALATAQHGVSRKAAERRVLGWGMFSPQLSLAF